MTHKCMQIFKMVKLGKFPCRTVLGLNVACVHVLSAMMYKKFFILSANIL